MRRSHLPTLLALLSPLAAQAPDTTATSEAPFDAGLLAGLEARAIGPAVCSGRIGAVAGVPGDPSIVWVGAASGGVWKSTDGGVRFTPVFDDQDVTSIGAIAIDPRSPDIVWVGSGEGNPRNSASVGRGIYKTVDGGQTWQKLGLDKTERIHRILLHPQQPDTAWVAAFGTSWNENEERGVFKTTDGGKTWSKVLYVDERTGCGDLTIDPRNPDKLFAGMWQHRRWPWAFQSGGPGSGLYRTVDGGTTWQRLGEREGMPAGELGRIGLAIAPGDPRVVYALTEAKKSALLRSDDGGFHFRSVNTSDGIAPRPFYFGDIRVDPVDAERLYSMHTVIDVSTDGGRSFAQLVGWDAAHPDHHAMWIDPQDATRILIGNDGGVYQSQDRGRTWRFCANLPLAQFYHVAVDDDVPYHVYGGLQDNGSWRGPSSVWENGGIRNLHWQEVCFGDGFATVPMADDSNRGYAMSQGGSLVRWDLRNGSRKSIRPPAPADVELRFHWNAAIALDPFDPNGVFYGSQFVHKSRDRGESWTVISPDLTTDNAEWQKQDESGGLTRDVTAAENHCTILSIAPSPLSRDVIWVGTDDGRVQVTTDGGTTWTSVEQNVPGLPRNTWCPHVEASRFDANTAYAVFDGHRRTDWTTYVYVTRDAGATWTSLATPTIDGYCHCIEQDPVKKELLWLGTEFGLWLSLDEGSSWVRYSHGVPTCAVRALVTHPRTGDLVVATHGRSLFVVDDITPLRSLTPELLQAPLFVFAPGEAIAYVTAQTPGSRFPGHGEFRGDNRERGLLLHVVANAPELKHPDPEHVDAAKADTKPDEAKPDEAKADKTPKDQVTVEVRDQAGALVRTFRQPVKRGLNRIVWRLERDGVQWPSRDWQDPPELPNGGRQVLPGDYRVTVRFQGRSQEVAATVLADPRVAFAAADRAAKDALRAESEAVIAALHQATQRLAKAKRQVDVLRRRLELESKPQQGAEDPQQALRDALKAVDEAHGKLVEQLWGPRVEQGIDRSNRGLIGAVQEHLHVTGTDDAPNQGERDGVARANAALPAVRDAVDAFVRGPLTALRAAIENSQMNLLPDVEPTGDGR